ncbi:hypothetical protein GTW69_07695, partial [Streptomyces sp. SID7760]|nr:hypothetical protein [Streptomyces sp. SID7760]
MHDARRGRTGPRDQGLPALRRDPRGRPGRTDPCALTPGEGEGKGGARPHPGLAASCAARAACGVRRAACGVRRAVSL